MKVLVVKKGYQINPIIKQVRMWAIGEKLFVINVSQLSREEEVWLAERIRKEGVEFRKNFGSALDGVHPVFDHPEGWLIRTKEDQCACGFSCPPSGCRQMNGHG